MATLPLDGLDAPPSADAGAAASGTPRVSGAARASGVARRPLPFPYRAALAVCSDLDETPDRALFVETLRFLNGTGATKFGDGLGLEVGNTIYFDMPADQFSYWNTDEVGRDAVHALIRSGHVDCLHSFGDLATTRGDAGRALDALARHGCALEVWIDHAVAPSNFGADIMRGQGDVVGSPVYHADLTCGFGVRYVWRGRVTSVIGQDTPRRLGGIFQAAHPLASAKTIAKELAKGVAAKSGSRKYARHGGNTLLERAKLRSGHSVDEFVRANPHWGGVSAGETARGIGEVLTTGMIDRLIERGGVSVLYTHLGKTPDTERPFDERGLAAWRRLAHDHATGRVLVTTTRRLLAYTRTRTATKWDARADGETTRIDVSADEGVQRRDLDGLTFYVADAYRTRLCVNGVERLDLQRNQPDHSGRPSVSIPWTRLQFPAV